MMQEKIQNMLEADDDLAIWFQLLCENPAAMKAQAWQFQLELWDRGESMSLQHVVDVLFDLAHELCPDSPAGSDEMVRTRQEDIYRAAMEWAATLPVQQQEIFAESLGSGLQDAAASGVKGFRNYLRSRCAAAHRKPAA